MSELSVALGAVVSDDFIHEAECSVGPHAFIGPSCIAGEGVRIEARATVMAPEPAPDGVLRQLTMQTGVVVGAGAVVCGAEVVGRGARIEPGAVVTSDVPPHAVVAGNPAYVTGYVSLPTGAGRGRPVEMVHAPNEVGSIALPSGASLIRFPEVADLRGLLTFAEVEGQLPFSVGRFFLVYGVPSQEVRGEHAHRQLHQLLVAVAGSVSVLTDNGAEREEVRLDDPTVGVHIPPMVWGVQFRHTADAVLMVLASDRYDGDDYIRDYSEFLSEVS